MDAELRQQLQEILNMSNQEKVQLGRESLAHFVQGLKEGGLNDDQVNQAIVCFTRLFVSADLDCNQSEYDFFRAVTGVNLSPDEFFEMTNHGRNEEFVKSALEFVHVLHRDDRIALILYGSALISSDDRITGDEGTLIERILNA